MIVIGRIVLKRRNSMNTAGGSSSESTTTVEAITKLQTTDTVITTTSITDECTEHTSDDMDMDLSTPISIPSISSRNNVRILLITFMCVCMCAFNFCSVFQHLYNTYTPSSYGNLEPSSISYALVTPNLYSNDQALHGGMIRPQNLYNHSIPPNLSMC